MCGIRVRTGFTEVRKTAGLPRDCNGDDDFVAADLGYMYHKLYADGTSEWRYA